MAEAVQAELSSDEEVDVELQQPENQEESQDATEVGAEVEQETEEFEVVLGSAEEPSAEDKVAKKPRSIKRLLANRREDRSRIAELEQQLAATQTTPQTNDLPLAPTLESVGFDEEALRRANSEYQIKLAQTAAASVVDQQLNGTRRAQQEEQLNGVITAHYERAEKLNLPDYEEVESKVIEILDQNAVSQIAQIVPNSEAVVYYLGKNPSEALRIREIWEKNPGQAAFELGGLSKDLKIVPKQRKPSPAPESKVRGAAPATKSSIEKDIEKERGRIVSGETHDMTQLNRLKGQLRGASD